MSKRKMFGKYFHSIITHAPILISLRSLNAELQERAFGQANAICRSTSNYHPDHIVNNVVVRFQIEANREKENLLSTQNSVVSGLARELQPFTNTVLPSSLLENNAAQVQSHLERVSDFLLHGQGIWWKKVNEGIEFLDSDKEAGFHPCGPELHHFRSSNMLEEVKYLERCWQSCIEREVELPLAEIRRYSEAGELISLETCTTTANVCERITDTQTEGSVMLVSNDSTNDASMEVHNDLDNVEDFDCENEYCISTQVSSTLTSEEKPQTSVSQSPPTIEMKTSLAKSLVNIVSNIRLLKRFDNLRQKAKEKKKGSRVLLNRQYTSCSQLIKVEVVAACERIQKQIADYEKGFILENDRLPTLTEYPSEIKALIHKRNITQKVLAHEWNTS